MSLCALANLKKNSVLRFIRILRIRVFTDHGKKTNATRDGERVVRGWTEEVWGEKVESEGWAEGGTACRKPGEITDNGPRELEIGKKKMV